MSRSTPHSARSTPKRPPTKRQQHALRQQLPHDAAGGSRRAPCGWRSPSGARRRAPAAGSRRWRRRSAARTRPTPSSTRMATRLFAYELLVQRDDASRRSLVRSSGYCCSNLLAMVAHLGLRLLKRDARLEPPDDGDVMAPAILTLLLRQHPRRPEVRFSRRGRSQAARSSAGT